MLTFPKDSPVINNYQGTALTFPGDAPAVTSYSQPIQTEKPNPVSVISSQPGAETIDNHIADHNQDMKNLGGAVTPSTPTKETPPAPNTSTVDSTLKSQGGISLDEVNASGVDTTNYIYDPKTKYFMPKKDTTAPGPDYSGEEAKVNSQFDALTKNMDAASQNLVQSIKDIYTQRFADAQEVNRGSLAAAGAFNQRYGRYSPKSGVGVLSLAETAAMNRLSKLSSEEAGLLAQANQSLADKKYQAFVDQRNQLNDLRKEKVATLQKLQDQAYAEKQAALKRQQDISDRISNISLEAAKNGADPETQTKIKSATTESDAIAAAGDYLQTGTGMVGDYIRYKRDTIAKGLVPKDYQTYKDEQGAKQMQAEINKAVKIQEAKNKSDAEFTASDKNQQKLEQQYRVVLSKEFSSRTGALGIENQKVNQANHLNSLFTQYYDPKTGDYNIPKAQYGEAVLGLANLIAPSGVASDTLRNEITQRTLAGDIAGALSYVIGVPLTGSTQSVFKNLVDSVDRQAETAIRNREAALQNLRDQAPTDLEQSRIDALNRSTKMVGYEGQDRISKSLVNDYVTNNPSEAEDIAKLYEVPGATDKDIEDYLRAQGKIQ